MRHYGLEDIIILVVPPPEAKPHRDLEFWDPDEDFEYDVDLMSKMAVLSEEEAREVGQLQA